MAVTVTPTPDPDYGRMLIDITFTNTAVTAVKVERRDPAMPWTAIRGGSAMAAVAGKIVAAQDSEAPLDTAVTYRATQVTPAGAETAESVSVTLPSNGVTWLRDPAFPSRSRPLFEVTDLPELTFATRAGVFNIIDRARPVVVAAKRQSWAGTLAFTTTTHAERDGIRDLLSRGQVLLLSVPSGYGVGNQYVHVGDAVETRVGLVTEQTRRWSLPVTNVDRPDTIAIAKLGMRWVDVKYKYPTWDDLLNARIPDGPDRPMTWDELLESTP